VCASAAQCAFDIPFISLSTFSPPKENPGNLPVRGLDLKEQEKIRSHWNKKKEKGFGGWLLRYQTNKQILGLAGSCASLVNTYHTVCFV